MRFSRALAVAAVLTPFLVQSADHSLTLEVGTSYYLPAQKPLSKGTGNFFAIDVPAQGFEVGYYFESLQLKAKNDDNNDGTATRSDLSANMHEVRAAVPLVENLIRVGIGLGAADVKGKTTTAAITYSDVAPVVEIFAGIQPIRGGDKVKAAINVILGYRLILTEDLDPDGTAGTDYASDAISNINGFRAGLSATVSF